MKVSALFSVGILAFVLATPVRALASGSFEMPDAPAPTVSVDPDSLGPRGPDGGPSQGTWGVRREGRQGSSTALTPDYLDCPAPALPGIDDFIARQPGSVVVIASRYGFPETVQRLKAAIRAQDLVLAASFNAQATLARSGSIVGPNQVLDVYPPGIAQRLVAVKLEAGNELPVRVYVYEDDAGQTWVKYHSLQLRLSPYANPRLMALGQEVDAQIAEIFAGALE